MSNKQLSEIEDIVDKEVLIDDVTKALEIIAKDCDAENKNFPEATPALSDIFDDRRIKDPNVRCRHKFPFGIWFRGHSRMCYELKPAIFRNDIDINSDDVGICYESKIFHLKRSKDKRFHFPCKSTFYEETSMFFHFIQKLPNYTEKYDSVFDLLCLMQHYGIPTRLLDWTESILTALFFAIKNKKNDNCDGLIFAINATRLNEMAGIFTNNRNLFNPSSLDTVIRSVIAKVRTKDEFIIALKKSGITKQVIEERITNGNLRKYLLGELSIDAINIHDDLKKDIEKLSYPIAVFPNRLNERMSQQLSLFTIHGGKSYDLELLDNFKANNDELLLNYKPLLELNREKIKQDNYGFLKCFRVPWNAKAKIREQLRRIGIHNASIFPELEYQAEFIKNQWSIHNEKRKYDRINTLKKAREEAAPSLDT